MREAVVTWRWWVTYVAQHQQQRWAGHLDGAVLPSQKPFVRGS